MGTRRALKTRTRTGRSIRFVTTGIDRAIATTTAATARENSTRMYIVRGSATGTSADSATGAIDKLGCWLLAAGERRRPERGANSPSESAWGWGPTRSE